MDKSSDEDYVAEDEGDLATIQVLLPTTGNRRRGGRARRCC